MPSILEQQEKTHSGCASELYRKTAHYVTPYVVPSVGVLCPRTVPSKRAFCYTFRRCVIPFGSDGMLVAREYIPETQEYILVAQEYIIVPLVPQEYNLVAQEYDVVALEFTFVA